MLAPKRQDIYLHIVRDFARFLGRSPDTATVEDLRRYQLYLVDHGTSAVSLNHAITGLKFFFTVTLDRPELMKEIVLAETSPPQGKSVRYQPTDQLLRFLNSL